MARRSSRRNTQNYNYGGREAYEFTKHRLPLSKINQKVSISDFEDRRHFHPEGVNRPAITYRSLPARYRVRTLSTQKTKALPQSSRFIEQNFEYPTYKIAFQEPNRVLVCARRKIRSEVLHALGFAGKKGLGRGGVTYNENSKYGC